MKKTIVVLGLLLVSAGAFAEQRIIAATIRNAGSGWYVIKDAEHKPIGVKKVTNDSEVIRVHFRFKAKAIHTFIVSLDEAYATTAPVICGASVSMTYADIKCGLPYKAGVLNPNAIATPGSNLWLYGVFSD